MEYIFEKATINDLENIMKKEQNGLKRIILINGIHILLIIPNQILLML